MEYKEADKDQPLYHPLAHVIINEDIVMINGREYEIIANVKDALDIEMLKEKYDPYLDPGSAYFILRLAQENQIKKIAFGRQNKRKSTNNNCYRAKRPYFKERRVHKTKIGSHKTAVKFQRGNHKNKSFVIKKRKG